MTKYLFFISLSLIFCNSIYAADIEVIELHTKKSLDQLVLEVNDSDEVNEEINQAIDENEISLDSSNNSEQISEVEISNDDNGEEQVDNDNIVISETTSGENLNNTQAWNNLEPAIIEKYLNNINSIKSDILYKEFINLLSNFRDINENPIKSEIFIPVVKKLYEIGEIQKAYNLLQLYQIDNIKVKENIIFYKSLELNYLLSTYQLSEACDFKNSLTEDNVSLPNYLLEKTDIFCLLIDGKIAESELLNSLLLEIETQTDSYFQDLYSFMTNKIQESNDINLILSENYSPNLIFLYSAMMRISELPLSEKFLQIDPNNLSIPVILSSATDMKTRLKAANKSYLNNIISIESLSALYQSVDFSSAQLNNPDQTILSFANDNETLMAFYYQLANIQIFPSERLQVILNYWQFAQKKGLEKIAYSLTNNIISSLEPSLDYANFGSKIATAHIFNKNYEEATKWIIFYENSNDTNDDITKVKFLLELYNSTDIDVVSNFLKSNLENFDKNSFESTKELIYVILNSLEIDVDYNMEIEYDKVFDDRLMPSIFLTSSINSKINDKDHLNLFLLILVSLNDKNWNDLHPQHLQLILKSFKEYNNSLLLKPIIIEILNVSKIL